MRKVIYLLLIVFLITLSGCTKNEIDDNIIYPNEPYSLDDHDLIKDEYAFYDISGSQVRYWGSANVHDPVMVKENDYYYIFSTDAQFGVTSQKGIHIRKTKDFISYEFVGTALDMESIKPAIEYVEYNRDGDRVDFFWAPEIYIHEKEDGTKEYWLFYSNSSFGQRTSFMGLAKADNIEGPYTHEIEILRTHQSVGSPNAIDPAIFTETVDGEKKMYLSYGSWSAGIYVIELNPNTGEPLIKQTLELREAHFNTSEPGQTTIKTKALPTEGDLAFGTRILNIFSAEAPHIIKEGNYYYLFVTTGLDLTYDYNVRVFRSESILGPYYDSEDNLAVASSNANNFRRYGNMITDAHHFINDVNLSEKNRGWAGIGHSSTYKEDNGWLFLSHYRGTHIDKDRFFFGVRKMHFINGWPLVEANKYVKDEVLIKEGANLSGEYQIHLLNKNEVNSKLENNIIFINNYAKKINLENTVLDENWMVVSGDYEGKWRYVNNLFELEINDEIYQGIISPQWHFERHKPTISFSLMDNNGYSLWGIRYS